MRFAYRITLGMFLCLASLNLYAQSAAITGSVEDSTGAALRGAEVRIVEITQGTTRTTQTNDVGAYNAPFLNPGLYRVYVQAPGFSTAVSDQLTLTVGQTLVFTVKLEVGKIQQQVTVVAGASMIATTDASVSTLVDQQFIQNMPLNGQSIQNLIAITPGAQRTGGAGQFSFNGVRDNNNYIMVDGVAANVGTAVSEGPGGLGQYGAGQAGGYTALGTSSSLGSLGDIQEINVEASTYPAEYGRTSGGQIQIATQRGSNTYHGDVFEYLRNSDFDAYNSYTKYLNSVLLAGNSAAVIAGKPPLRQNDFGGVLGGPIRIPFLYNGRSKSFFFISHETVLLDQPNSQAVNVPSTCARANNCVDDEYGDWPAPMPAATAAFLTFAPVANSTYEGEPAYLGSYSNPSNSHATSLRLDQQLTSRVSLFVRGSYTPSAVNSRTLNNISNGKFVNQSYTFGSNAQITSHIVNELRLNYTRNNGENNYTLDTYGGASLPTAAMYAEMFPSAYGASTLNSTFTYGEYVGAYGNGTQTSGPNNQDLGYWSFQVGQYYSAPQRQFNLVDNVAWAAGKHVFKFGVDWRELMPISAPFVYSQLLSYYVPSDLSSGVPTLGIGQSDDQVTVHVANYGLYAQDTWRVSPKLTVNYGVRFDINPAPHAVGSQQLYEVTASSVLNPAAATLAPGGTQLYPTKYGTFQPRIGASYVVRSTPDYETVVRGGFGIFYDTNDDTGINATADYPHFRAAIEIEGVSWPGTPLPPPPAVNMTAPYTNQNLLGFDSNFTLPLTYEWNVAVQQGLGHNQAMQVAYVASAGRNLNRLSDYPGSYFSDRFLNLDVYSSSDYSNYNSLQIAYQRRLYKGLQVLANYVWSKSLDTLSSDTINAATPQELNPSLDYGLSDFNVRNNFNISLQYDFPTIQSAPRAVKYALGHWSMDNIFLVHNGNPLTAQFTRTISGSAAVDFRPDVVSGEPLWIPSSTFGGKKVNPAAFSEAYVTSNPTQIQGNEPRGYITGLTVSDWDATLRREFSLPEKIHLQFRADAFNILNQTLYANPNMTLGSMSSKGVFTPETGAYGFGLITNTLNKATTAGSTNLGGGFYGIGRNRSLQLALKVRF